MDVVSLRIEVDREKCMGQGTCEFYAPATFALDDEGISSVVDPDGDPEDKIVLAAQGCPTQAIAVFRGHERIA
jgi:ferredoxin